MRNKSVYKIFFIIFILQNLFTGSVRSQDTEFPFDYLYGRWTSGHYSDLKHKIDNDNKYHRFGNYIYYSKKHFFELINLQEFLFIDNKDNTILTPYISYSYRPSDKWQIGVNNIQFSRKYRYPANKILPDIFRPKRDKIVGKISSRLISDKYIKVNERNTPYFYYIDEIVSTGQYVLETDISIDSEKEYNVYWFSGNTADRRLDKNSSWSVKNFFSYGLTNELNVKINLNAYFTKNSSDKKEDYNSGDTLLITRVSESESQSKRYDYNLSFVDLRLLPFYYNISFGQNNTISIKDIGDTEYYYDNVYENSSGYDERYDYNNDNNKWGVLLGYLSKGEFNSKIILDDYNNYYHKLLFHKQYNVSLNIKYENGKSIHDRKSSQTNLNLQSSIGLYNKFEIGLNAEYTYREYESTQRFFSLPTGSSAINKIAKITQSLSGYSLLVTMYQESINAGLKIKFRSYDFNENSMYSWDNSSKYDIMFGYILTAKQYFFELNYNPIHYNVSTYLEEINIFDFTNASHQFGGYIDMHLSVGLGKQYGLSVNFFNTLLNNDPLRNYSILTENGHIYSYSTLSENKSFDISIMKRIIDKFDLSLQYQYDDAWNKEIYTGTLKFLL